MAEEKAAAFLKGLQIKGVAFGGFDKTETFTKFKELACIYEEIVAKERSGKEFEQEESVKLRTELSDKRIELDKLHDNYYKLETENRELKEKVRESMNQPVYKGPVRSDFDVNVLQESEELTQKAKQKSEAILSDARREAENLLINARNERDSILKEAHDDALRRRADLQNEIVVLRNEKKTILTELNVIQDQLDGVMQSAKDAGMLTE